MTFQLARLKLGKLDVHPDSDREGPHKPQTNLFLSPQVLKTYSRHKTQTNDDEVSQLLSQHFPRKSFRKYQPLFSISNQTNDFNENKSKSVFPSKITDYISSMNRPALKKPIEKSMNQTTLNFTTRNEAININSSDEPARFDFRISAKPSTRAGKSSQGNSYYEKAPLANRSPPMVALSGLSQLNKAEKPVPMPVKAPLQQPLFIKSPEKKNDRLVKLTEFSTKMASKQDNALIQVNIKTSPQIKERGGSRNIFSSVCGRTIPGSINNLPKENQDQHFYELNFLQGAIPCSVLAVLDGHGKEGGKVSKKMVTIVRNQLKAHLTALKNQKRLEDVEMVKSSLVRAFQSANSELINDASVDSEMSGTTCVCAIAIGSKLFLANLGDSGAYMVSRESRLGTLMVNKLTKDHLASVPEEAARIERCGGRVGAIRDLNDAPIGPLRVWKKYESIPGLMMTRSFGDSVGHSVGMISIPDIIVHEWGDTAWGIMLGSDGLFENANMGQVLKQQYSTSEQLCGSMLDNARSIARHYNDDATCLIATFARSR